jgi:DNA-binding NarL/FixJ family response regulator
MRFSEMKKNPPAPKKHRILLVEDHPMTRMGLRMMIDGEDDLEVCGEAGDAAAGFSATLRLDPALVLTDVTLPGRSGFELVQDLAARCPRLPVLVVSMHAENTYARRALEIGARGYIMKSESGEAVLGAIRTVLDGRIYLSPAAGSQLLEFVKTRSKRNQSGVEALSPREFEVFKLFGDGTTTKAIAGRLNLSTKTVDTHRSRIKDKLGTASMSELIALAASWSARQSMTPPAQPPENPD